MQISNAEWRIMKIIFDGRQADQHGFDVTCLERFDWS